MAYEKRLCVLKQVKKGFTADGGQLSGAVYAERYNGELTFTPRIAGLAPVREGRYALAVQVGERKYCLELKGNRPLRVPDAPTLERGFSALVCFVRGSAEPIAFGSCGGASASFESLLSMFEKKERTPGKPLVVPLPPEGPMIPSPQTPEAPVPVLPGPEEGESEKDYDDEAIAAENYYAETDPQESARAIRRGLTYFREVRERLESAMASYPEDKTLCDILPHSRWVRTESALLGILYEEGLPRYLCVAVGAQGEVPASFRDACVYVPASHYSDEAGYFIVFQDAETGAVVKTYDA